MLSISFFQILCICLPYFESFMLKNLKLKHMSLPMHNIFIKLFLLGGTDRPGLKDIADVQKLNEKVLTALKQELGKTHANENVLTRLMQLTWTLRQLSSQHIVLLNKYKLQNPEVEFPALHKELFSVEGLEGS